MKKPLMKKPWGRGDGGSWGQATAVMVMFPPLADDNPFPAAPSTSSATSCVTSSATSCAASFTCVLHVSPKGERGGTRVFGVGSGLADGDGQDKHLRGAWVPPLEDNARHGSIFYAQH